MQLEGLFDIAPSQRQDLAWEVEIPLEEKPWNIGLIVGPSGCGKSTIARELFGEYLVDTHNWHADRSVVDGFPEGMGIKEITGFLNSVGFNSPPSWLRPFRVLSTGEQFRVTVARALAESRDIVVIDEFTSVVDRTVAQLGSSAIAKAVRRAGQKFIGVSCHYDIIDWLQPDWVYEPASGSFAWRLLQRRPEISLEIVRSDHTLWRLFRPHHYLTGTLSKSATCFIALSHGRPVAFCSVRHFPHPVRNAWMEHRTVVLPDYQGVGIGNVVSEYVASLFVATGKPFRGPTSHPAYIHHRLKSPLWKLARRPSMTKRNKTQNKTYKRLGKTAAWNRLTSSFEYVGPARPDEAKKFGILK